jgi:hypothetical protein
MGVKSIGWVPVMNIIRVLSLSLSLSLMLGEARADKCDDGVVKATSECNMAGADCELVKTYCDCDKGCTPDEPFLGFIHGCKKIDNWPFGSACQTHEKPEGPVGHLCRCKPEKTKPGMPKVDELAQQAIELQERGLVQIVCREDADCPNNSKCESGACRNQNSAEAISQEPR